MASDPIGPPQYVRRPNVTDPNAPMLMVRDVRGDGCCGYRAVLFGALEHNWNRTVDRLPIMTLPWLPRRRPPQLAHFWAKHDEALCQVARDVTVSEIRAAHSHLSWAGNPEDTDTEAGQSLIDAMNPTGWMDVVAMHALATRLDIHIAILYDDGTTVRVPLFGQPTRNPVSLCLLPSNAAQPTEVAGHYMLAYPGHMHEHGRMHLMESRRTTTL